MYVIQFQSSDEAKDERGKEIQYKTNNVLYTILYLGIVAIIVFQSIDIVSSEFLPDLLLYFLLSLSVLVILSPLGRQCEKDHVYTWMLHYYLEGIFHGQKRYNI